MRRGSRPWKLAALRDADSITENLALPWKQQRVNILPGVTARGMASLIDGFDRGYLRQFALAAEEMIEREPKTYAKFKDNEYVQPGGPGNPLGARALYLFKGSKDTLFRIDGTNEPDTIGKAVSSGCIRMLNSDVVDLYRRVSKGARVVVL